MISLYYVNEDICSRLGVSHHLPYNKVISFGRTAFSYSAVQPPFYANFPGNWTALGNSGLPGETISLPVLCTANVRRPRISNLHRNYPTRVPIHTLVEWSLGDSISCAHKNSR